MEKQTINRDQIFRFFRDYFMYLVLIILVVFFSVRSQNFLTPSNLLNVINQSAYQIVVGVGIAFIMLSGAIDLSTGYQISTLGVIAGVLLTKTSIPYGWVILIILALGVVLSLINGIFYVTFDTFPFMITLATQYILWGISFMISNSATFTPLPAGFKMLGQGYIGPIPIAILVMLVIVLIGAFLLNKTYFGRYVYGLGSNQVAIELAGVKTRRLKLIIFAMAGLFTALGTLMLVSRSGSSSSTMGPGMEFTIIAGCMLGGIKMGGGGGKISSVVIGLLILTVLSNGMQLMQLGTYPQKIALGVVLLVAIGLDVFQSKSAIRTAKKVVGGVPAKKDTKV
jgi:ribose transport system permease protein